jgi:DNA-binding MurR/RpiR family transcriptional regulator
MNYRERIISKSPRFTPVFKRVGDFIIGNYIKVAFMSASEVARELDVDITSVIRFSQRIGYSNFTELLREIQVQVMAELEEKTGSSIGKEVYRDTIIAWMRYRNATLLYLASPSFETAQEAQSCYEMATRLTSMVLEEDVDGYQ